MEPDDLSIPNERARPWYMMQGEMLPRYLSNNTATASKIFPEQLPGHDRIPGKYQGKHV